MRPFLDSVSTILPLPGSLAEPESVLHFVFGMPTKNIAILA